MENQDIKTALRELRVRAEHAAKGHMYYDGTQPDVMDRQRWEQAFGKNVAQPRDEMAQMIVDITVERLKIDTIVARVGDTYSETAAKEAEVILKRNRGDQLVPDTHRTAGITRCAGVIVGVNARGQAVLYPQLDCTIYVHPNREEPGKAAWAAKTWTEDGTVRLNMYYPDRTEKYVSRTNRWIEFLPVLHTAFVEFSEVEPNPFGFVPVFAFELRRGDLEAVYSLVDHGNKAFADIMNILDAAGFPQKVLTGVRPAGSTALPSLNQFLAAAATSAPAQGGSVLTGAAAAAGAAPGASAGADLEVGPRRIMTLHSDAAKALQFDAAPLDGPIKVLDNLRLAQARNGRLPLHYVALNGSNQQPSEGSKRAGEQAQTAKVESRQTLFGNSWEDTLAAAYVMENSTDDNGVFTELVEWPDLEVNWLDAYIEAGLTAVERVQSLIDLKVPAWRILRDEFGYSEEEAKEIGDEIEAERDAEAEREAATFSRGATADTAEVGPVDEAA